MHANTHIFIMIMCKCIKCRFKLACMYNYVWSYGINLKDTTCFGKRCHVIIQFMSNDVYINW